MDPSPATEALPRLEHRTVTVNDTHNNAVRKANVRTGLTLASIALVFFVGVFAARLIGSPIASIAVIGSAVLLFLVVAIGRHLRK